MKHTPENQIEMADPNVLVAAVQIIMSGIPTIIELNLGPEIESALNILVQAVDSDCGLYETAKTLSALINACKPHHNLLSKELVTALKLVEQQLTEKIGIAGISQEVNDKSIYLFSGLKSEGRRIKPYGKPIYTTENRQRLYKNILSLNMGNRKIGAGCSILLNIFSDHLTEKFFEFIRDAKNSLNENLLITLDNGKSKNGKRRELAWRYFANVKGVLGALANQGNIGSSWSCPIGLVSTLSASPIETQKGLLQTYQELELLASLIGFESQASGRAFKECFQLLIDFACQEMHSLFLPTQPDPEYKDHFYRLQFRLSSFSKLLTSIDDLILSIIKLPKHNEFKKLMNEFVKTNILKVSSLENELKILAIDGSHKPQLLLNLYQKLKKLISNIEMPTAIAFIREELKSMPDKNLSSLDYVNTIFANNLLSDLINTMNSVVSEAITILFRELIERGNIGNDSIDQCTTEIINLLKATQNNSVEEITGIIDQLQRNYDTSHNVFTDATTLGVLNSLWRDDITVYREKVTGPFINLLEERLVRCRSNPAFVWERALTLRDTLTTSMSQVARFYGTIRLSFIRLDSIKQQHGLCEEIQQLYDEMDNFVDIQQEAINAVISGIEALIGKYFSNIQREQLEASKKSDKGKQLQLEVIAENSKQLLAESSLKKKKKKKTKRTALKSVADIIPTVKARPMSEEQLNSPLVSDKTIQPKLSNALPVAPLKQLEPAAAASGPATKPIVQTLVSNPAPVVKAPSLQDIPPAKFSLNKITPLIDSLAVTVQDSEIDGDFRTHWRDAQLFNLKGYVLRWQMIKTKVFNASAIFDQTDIASRMIEAALEITLSHYPSALNQQSLLREISDNGHQLHITVQKLLWNQGAETQIPEAVRALVWDLRAIAYELSQANSCVNYLHSNAVKIKHLSPQANTLTRYLLMIEKESNALNPNHQIRSALLQKHEERMRNALYFVHRLLDVTLIPKQNIIVKLPTKEFIAETLATELRSLQPLALVPSPAFGRVDEDINIPEIASQASALRALRQARALISIRLFSPVRGWIDIEYRTQERNAALKNLDLYLLRLIQKLLPERLHRLYDTLVSEWSLMRRAHKELIIAALFHGEFFNHGAHLVAEKQLRYVNNPCYLMKELKQNVPNPNQLPHLGSWLARVHPVLSYQKPLRVEEGQDRESEELRAKLYRLRECASQKALLKGGFTLVNANNPVSADVSQEKVEKMVTDDEREKIFPAIMAIFQTLKVGMPLEQSLLNAAQPSTTIKSHPI